MNTHLPKFSFKKGLVIFLSLPLYLAFFSKAYAASLSLTPPTGSFSGNFDVTISVDPQGASISGVDVILKYEPDKLEAQVTQNGVFEQYLRKNIDKTTGSVAVSAYNTATLISSTATVAKITFKPLVASGTTALTIVYTPSAPNTPPNTDDSNVASGGGDVLSGVTGASYTLQGTGVTTTTTPTVATTPATTPKPAVPATGDSFTALIITTICFGLIMSGTRLLKSRSNFDGNE